MKILLTGATGFIGNRLVNSLSPGHDVTALARRLPEASAGSSVRWIEQDLALALDHSRLPDRVDAIIHLAQSRFYRRFPEKAKDIFEVNIASTLGLLEYARRAGAERFILASSGGVYGYSDEKFVETDPVNPLDFYLSSKYTSELLTANYHSFFHTAVFRFFFVYGPGQENMLIPSLINKVRRNELIRIQGDPGIRINPIHISDAVRVFEPALHLDSPDLFNVSGDEAVTIRGLVEKIELAAGRDALVECVAATQNGDLVGDNSRMHSILGIKPMVSLSEGIDDCFRSKELAGRSRGEGL